MGILDNLRIKKGTSVALEQVRRDGLSIKNIIPEYINYDVALAAVQQNGMALQYIDVDAAVPFNEGLFDSELKKKQKEHQVYLKKVSIVLAAVKQNPRAIAYAGWLTLNSNVQNAVNEAIYASGQVDEELLRYFNICRIRKIESEDKLGFITSSNRNFITEYIKHDATLIKFVKHPVDSEISAALKQDGLLLGSILGSTLDSIPFRLIPHYASMAVEQNGLALAMVKPDIFGYNNDYYINIALKAVRQNGMALQYFCPPRHVDGTQVVTEALIQNGLALQYLPSSYDYNPLYALTALKQNFAAIQYVKERMLNDKQFIMQSLLIAASSNYFSSEEIDRIGHLYNNICTVEGEIIPFEYMHEYRQLFSKFLPENEYENDRTLNILRRNVK